MLFQPTISIIIAVKNAKQLLQETLESIRCQEYKIDTVVVDGCSIDGVEKLVDSYQDVVSTFISEPDKNISDAFNKGLKVAKGEYINFHGAGDTLYSPDCLKRLFENLDYSYALIAGKVMRVEEDGKTPIWIAPKTIKPFNPSSLLFKMSLPHQGLFTHRDFFKKYGDFSLDTRFAMDYELLLRAYKDFPRTIVKDVIVSRWRAGGIGSNRIGEIFDEYHAIKVKHHVASRLCLNLIDKFTRFKYHLKTKLKIAY